ncbi:MAG: hypothetical protein N2578_08050, partial [Bdellovibrionaceae bacterium]|nr:hypothetical protein [Pseudobdellovibrionaceae bacterium]
KYVEVIERFIEDEKDFLVLISRRAAFYRFPKTVTYAGDVRNFLSDRMKKKRLVEFEVDPTTAQILKISDHETKSPK